MGAIHGGNVVGRGQVAEYRLIAPIAEPGGEGWVWQAEYLAPKTVRRPNGLVEGDHVALKILNDEHRFNRMDQFEERWSRIAEFYADGDWHQNLVRIHEAPFRGKLPHHPDDYFEWGAETLYLPMEYLEGSSLRALVNLDVPQSVRRGYVRALHGVAEGLAELAAVRGEGSSGSTLSKRVGLVHRDVKPDNILFPPGRAPVLIDFGSIREMFTSRMYTGISGTQGYIAPEVTDDTLDWALRATPAVDLYGFACVVYFALSAYDPPVQQSRWNSHLTDRLGWISSDTRAILGEVLLEENPAVRLQIDIADWSGRIISSLFPGEYAVHGTGATDRRPRELTPTVARPPQPPAAPREEVSGPSSENKQVSPYRSHQKAELSLGKPSQSGTGRSTHPAAVPKSGVPARADYLYLKARGTVTSLPSSRTTTGTIQTEKGSRYTFSPEPHHLTKPALEEGASVRFIGREGGKAEHVFLERIAVTRIFSNGKPAPYRIQGASDFGGFLGLLLSIVSYLAAQFLWPQDHAWWAQIFICLGVGVTALIVIAIISDVSESKIGDYELRTWWEEHYTGRYAMYLGLIGIAIGFPLGAGGNDILFSPEWPTIGSLLAGAFSSVAAVFIVSLAIDGLVAGYRNRTGLPSASAASRFFIVFKVVFAIATFLVLIDKR